MEAIPETDVLATRMDAAGLEKGEDRERLESAMEAFSSRLAWVSSQSGPEDLAGLHDSSPWVEHARAQIDAWNRDASALLSRKDSNEGVKRLETDRVELLAQQWVAGQKDAIQVEVARLIELKVLKAARDSATTTGLSTRRASKRTPPWWTGSQVRGPFKT